MSDPQTSAASIQAGAALLGGGLSAASGAKEGARNRYMQYDFAKNSIRWRTEDAKRAGIHPLAALGAPTVSASPVLVGDSIGPAVADAGQHIGRAVAAKATPEERAFTAAMQAEQLKRAQNENKLLEAQYTAISRATTPAFPTGTGNFMPGQGNSGAVVDKPLERTTSHPLMKGSEPGAVVDRGFAVLDSGDIVPVPSADVKQKIEDILPHEIAHFIRNNVMPNFTGGNPPPGYKWSAFRQAYHKYQPKGPKGPSKNAEKWWIYKK